MFLLLLACTKYVLIYDRDIEKCRQTCDNNISYIQVKGPTVMCFCSNMKSTKLYPKSNESSI